jgi:hypothetical protein
MTERLAKLWELARTAAMTAEDLQAQRISFAYGNAAIEDPHITRDHIIRAAEALDREAAAGGAPQQ